MKTKLKIKTSTGYTVSGILQMPEGSWCLMVLAHGAGAGMEHSFMQDIANRLEKVGIATLRFNFLYMEKGGGRPDLPHMAYEVIRAVVEKATEYATQEKIPVVGGGKSFGGRMFSQLMSTEAPADISALVFFGFPLHAPGAPGTERAEHLSNVKVPLLFLQGSRDTFAQHELIKEVVKGLRKGTLSIVEDGDHGFHVPKKSAMTDEQVLDHLVSETSTWLRKKM